MKNVLYFLPVVLALLLAGLFSGAAGTSTVLEYRQGNVHKIVCNWASDATGDVARAKTTRQYSGRVTAAIFEPSIGDASPDPNYDVYLYNAFGLDVLRGNGVNRSQATTDVIQLTTAVPLAADELVIFVTHAGTVASGTAYFYIEP